MRPGPSLLVLVVALAADQATKFWVEANLPLYESVPVAPFLSFFRTYNTGISFSFLAGMDAAWLIALTLALLAFIAWLWYRTETDRFWARAGFALVFGGALGNLIDRVMLGHVVDFIRFHTESWSFAVFNLADSFITVGAALIILDEFLAWRGQVRGG